MKQKEQAIEIEHPNDTEIEHPVITEIGQERDTNREPLELALKLKAN
ncbi:hypothetical protein [Halalkalibacter nanhaiisediminis]|uniref:Uncharacterized protein n=1 Tax=Halalkalibacter nanhaiisediminis TaxID=688079 RepID=A0A562QME1_9BACI|nr:hypothetical protein [Halalkalibacter nanhaiisediminis]TWI57928.1 hypothetical protein IQ10_01257 [Halalkalibacter nanhaiisediminis]